MPEQFGIFYVANTVAGILFSGSIILNMYLTRHLAAVRTARGEGAAIRAVIPFERALLTWGAGVAAAACLAMIVLPVRTGVHSWPVLLLIVLEAFTSYICDIGRAVLQSLRRTVALGLYTLVWMVVRLVLCIAGILLFHSVQGALGGVIASTMLTYAGFRFWALAHGSGERTPAASLPSLAALLPAICGFGLLITVSNLDVLMGYLLLPQEELGIYSASSIFPKMILAGTLPLLQMLYPIMIGDGSITSASRGAAVKSAGVVVLLPAAGILLLWLLSDRVCGGRWGIRSCSLQPFGILLVTVVPLALLRFLVVNQFVRGQEWRVLWLLIPTGAYLGSVGVWSHSMISIAEGYAAFSVAACLFCLSVWHGIEAMRWRRI